MLYLASQLGGPAHKDQERILLRNGNLLRKGSLGYMGYLFFLKLGQNSDCLWVSGWLIVDNVDFPDGLEHLKELRHLALNELVQKGGLSTLARPTA